VSTTTTPARRGIGAKKPITALGADGESGDGLERAVGALDLTALGIGAIIGTGIFVIIGEAIGDSGPAIVLSFVLAGITCVFSALSYAELAASIPVSGSAYSYTYATLGELVAWIIGWDLIIEYGLSVAVVAVGWGQYLQDLLQSILGVNLPDAIAKPPGGGGTVNLTAVVLVLGVTALLVSGVRESARANTVMVGLKLAILGFFIIAGIFSFKGSHFSNFTPHGFSGVSDAASIIFFAYIGFDAVSTAGGEAKNPGRDLPIAIVGSLIIATVVYILVAVVAVGLTPASQLAGADAPLTTALRSGSSLGSWAGDILSFGALIAITSVVLTILYGQTRIFWAMTQDGLVPQWFGKLSPRRTPTRITLVFGLLVAALAAFIPLSELAKLVNIGTLFAFVLVNAGVIYLRHAEPDMDRPFRSPLVPVMPIIGICLCIYLMSKLQTDTWIRFGLWLLVGLVIYFGYGRRHSKVQRGEADGQDGGEGRPGVPQIVPGRGGRGRR
jgi:APA family basic amino acid/polyamine antiporter